MAVIPVILLNGTLADANEVMADFNEIYTNITNVNVAANAGIAYSKLAALPSAQILVGSAGNVATPVVMSGDATISNLGVVTVSGGGIVPIGTILPFYDYNGTLTFNAAKYAYCDGSIVNFAGIGPQTTPDLSGRYLIGFGTVGGGNIDTDPWATAAVGNAGWTINIQHSHTANAHTHGMQDHTHAAGTFAGPSHVHGVTELVAAIMVRPDGDYYSGGGGVVDGIFANMQSIVDPAFYWGPFTAVDGGPFNCDDAGDFSPNADGKEYTGGTQILGETDSSGAGAVTGTSAVPSTNTTSTASATGTDNQLSAAQEIRPSSIRVRYIIRYA